MGRPLRPQLALEPRCREAYRGLGGRGCAERAAYLEEHRACLPADARREAARHCYDGTQPRGDWVCPGGRSLRAGLLRPRGGRPPCAGCGATTASRVEVPGRTWPGSRGCGGASASRLRRPGGLPGLERELEDDEAPGFLAKADVRGAAQCADCGRVLFRKVVERG